MKMGEISSAEIQNPRITWEGCSVLLDINDGDRLVFARLNPAATLKIGDKNFSLQPLIGCPFGSLFQVETGSKGALLSRVFTTNEDDNNVQQKSENQRGDESKDNRALIDNNTAQTLSGEAINVLRREGATGDQIVEALIANSLTFENKTVFSQEKYRLKKQKKYAPKVLLRRPFARSICEAYFKKYPARIGFLRVDTLSLLLSMANVSASSDVLIVDMVGGLLTGAVAERLGGTGFICNTYIGAKPYSMDIVRIFNFNSKICSRLTGVTTCTEVMGRGDCSIRLRVRRGGRLIEVVGELLRLREVVDERSILRSSLSDLCSRPSENVQQQEYVQETGSVSSNGSLPTSDDNIIGQEVSMQEIDALPSTKACKSTKPGEKATLETMNLWKANGFSSLIIAAPELDTWTIVQELLPLLAYSAPFAIYHQYLQPLATCMHNLQGAKMALSLQISEPWLREYQVLPSRTHPCMQMSAFGGYILTGTKICNN
ncbi:hypothetical protein GIB67_005382 [Kingdonia uniflora]|uniref:tRNA (adenine(58)-N(1))-methyltransferase non-catalytic subunit TRM6 n=1 Tax=Kingdonia uniflora TaxID=39325 RepID=A0A7J7NHN6_9MAGN|nr:hypothetical protein GIB67_005382 [Kingdonia uniflora]